MRRDRPPRRYAEGDRAKGQYSKPPARGGGSRLGFAKLLEYLRMFLRDRRYRGAGRREPGG